MLNCINPYRLVTTYIVQSFEIVTVDKRLEATMATPLTNSPVPDNGDTPPCRDTDALGWLWG
eukprot:scaffold63048_cov65-Cyclotella_meneghiniana.AAC.8